MSGLSTVTEVKALLGITVTTYDTQITALLPVVENIVKLATNNDFDESPDDVAIKMPIALIIKDFIYGKDNISSESIGDYTVSFFQEKYYPLLSQFGLAKVI